MCSHERKAWHQKARNQRLTSSGRQATLASTSTSPQGRLSGPDVSEGLNPSEELRGDVA